MEHEVGDSAVARIQQYCHLAKANMRVVYRNDGMTVPIFTKKTDSVWLMLIERKEGNTFECTTTTTATATIQSLPYN